MNKYHAIFIVTLFLTACTSPPSISSNRVVVVRESNLIMRPPIQQSPPPIAAPLPMGRDKLGATREDYLKARFDCLKDAQIRVVKGEQSGKTQVSTSCSTKLFNACISAQGYLIRPGGRFSVSENCPNP